MEYSVRMRENTDQKNSKYGHFLRSGCRMEALDGELMGSNPLTSAVKKLTTSY